MELESKIGSHLYATGGSRWGSSRVGKFAGVTERPGGIVGGEEWEDLAVRVIRALAMDGPRAASSGHPGTAMALAPLAHVLFSRVMVIDPEDPTWPDRDRFVLSPGHASMLLYSMLHLTGYDLSLDDLRAFRQLGSKTPGHPEVGMTPGVEVTTGPLGQGFANAVGLAIAERQLRATHGADLCDHRVWCIVGDGCLEEGISHEAASLAGHLGLDRLVCIYDDNEITIDGPTSMSLNDDTAMRFRSYGWNVVELGAKADDLDAIEAALRSAAAHEGKPSLVILKSVIGWPSESHSGTAFAHGNPFSPDEIASTKERMGLPSNESFYVPSEVREGYHLALERGRLARAAWSDRVASAQQRGDAYLAQLSGAALEDASAALPDFEVGASIATRRAFGTCIQLTASSLPGLIAGSADLTENTGTELKGATAQSFESQEGSQLYYGVREHAMGAVMNGLALHGGVLPVGGTFFVFSDYMRGAIRVAAISEAHVVYVFTHDSIGVGEDGPTHQPIEHLASLRAMPGLTVLRPADAIETAQAWSLALRLDGPVALILSRQNLPVLEETSRLAAEGVARGGYVLATRGTGDPELVLVATGSEVSLALEAADLLAASGTACQVVSLPSFELFERLSPSERAVVLPPELPVLSVEAASTFGWSTYADDSVGIDRFGLSAPAAQAFEELGITAENVAQRAAALLARDPQERRRRH